MVVLFFLFSIIAIVAACIGGTSVALLIKNRTTKKLLLVGFCILFLIGLLCLTPFITTFANLPAMFFTVTSIFIYICIVLLTIAGIKFSNSISSKIGKTILIVIFCSILIIAISLNTFTVIGSLFFYK